MELKGIEKKKAENEKETLAIIREYASRERTS